MKYGQLSAKKPRTTCDRGYDERVWRELDDLYCGGYQILENAGKYIEKAVGESTERFNERKKLASYIGYLAPIVNVYASALFGQPIAVQPAADAENPDTPGSMPEPEVYEAFARDADLGGTPFVGVLQDALTRALVKKKALICCDFPASGGEEYKTRADSKGAGVEQPYIYEMEPEALIWWEYHDQAPKIVDIGGGSAVRWMVGRFSWCITRKQVTERKAPEDDVGGVVEEFKVWRIEEDGTVSWELYRVPWANGKPPKATADFSPEVAKTTTQFREIPIVEISLPEAMWIGNVVGPLNLEHWRRRSGLLAAQNRALITIPTIYLGPQIGGPGAPIPADIAGDQSRGEDPKKKFDAQGYLVLAQGDELRFEGPPTESFSIVNDELDNLVDEMHRVSGRMAASISNTSTALGRSGESKQADNADFCTILKALGAIVRDAARRVFEVVSEARGDDVRWTVHGLDNFDPDENSTTLIAEWVALAQGVDFYSESAKCEWVTRQIFKILPGLNPDTRTAIRQEVKIAVAKAGTGPLIIPKGGGMPMPGEQGQQEEQPGAPGASPFPPKLGARPGKPPPPALVPRPGRPPALPPKPMPSPKGRAAILAAKRQPPAAAPAPAAPPPPPPARGRAPAKTGT